ncbi:MAG: EAL domain-containing protein [Solirubrobacteraceae bacterium]|nr:EAL domain-containing protein [Solirubrobacteraceae bacterium]
MNGWVEAADEWFVLMDAAVGSDRELNRVLEERAIVSQYQPIVELASGRVAAYEALARGPQGSILEFPDRLFGAAREQGRLQELDSVCRAAALGGFAGSAVAGRAALFVNTEPDASAEGMVETYAALAAVGRAQSTVFEFTERALADRPAEVLAAARELRRLGAGIAFDDVGVDPRSLALLPFVQPDIVKLDMSIVQGARTTHAARVMHAVGAYAERTGASVVAEGIETPEHLEVARSLGATHGQGWLFGRPGALPTHLDAAAPLASVRRGLETELPDATAFGLAAAAGRPVQRGDKGLILSLSRQLELQAASLGPECVILGNLQHERHLTSGTAARYSRLASEAAFAGLIGAGVGSEPAPGVRGGSYPVDSVLAKEWSVVVISPHFAAAMVAIDLGDTGTDMLRRFDFCLTYDRSLVAAAARSLMVQIIPSSDRD